MYDDDDGDDDGDDDDDDDGGGAGSRFSYPRRMEGWVDLGGWLYIEMVYQSADSHSSK